MLQVVVATLVDFFIGLHSFCAALILTVASFDKATDVDRRILQQPAAQFATPESLALFVQSCTCIPMHDDARVIKVQWVAASDLTVLVTVVRRLLVAHGGILKFGAPPRSSAERAVRNAWRETADVEFPLSSRMMEMGAMA